MTKTVFVEPLWKIHSLHRSLMDFPPESYSFICRDSIAGRTVKAASQRPLSYRLYRELEKVVPLNLAIAYGRALRRPPVSDLTYSYSHLVLRKEPWILDLEYANLLVSPYPAPFLRHKKTVWKMLEGPYCRKVLCETEAGKKSVLRNLGGAKIEEKLDVLPAAATAKGFAKSCPAGTTRILFVGSANILGEFEIKGGREVLAAFVALRQKYQGLELVIRSDVPSDILRRYEDYPGIRIIENRLPWPELDLEFRSADIFFLPAHNTPFLAFLDAFSYELPVLTIDAWANSEFVEEGVTGLLAPCSPKIPYVTDTFLPTFGTARFMKAIKTPDAEVVGSLVKKASILIENTELRRRLGRAGRWEVENGKFSMRNRNERLKTVLDDATEGTRRGRLLSKDLAESGENGGTGCLSAARLR